MASGSMPIGDILAGKSKDEPAKVEPKKAEGPAPEGEALDPGELAAAEDAAEILGLPPEKAAALGDVLKTFVRICVAKKSKGSYS